jgi:hypothetical protein
VKPRPATTIATRANIKIIRFAINPHTPNIISPFLTKGRSCRNYKSQPKKKASHYQTMRKTAAALINEREALNEFPRSPHPVLLDENSRKS